MIVSTCVKNGELLTVPSDPLLKGARGSSRSSSELSSSEGVCLVRKWKENERKWERRRKTGKLEPSVSILPKVQSPF